MARFSKQDQREAREALAKRLTPGQTITTVLRSVSRSGMSRTLSVFVVEDGTLQNITYPVAVACGYTLNDQHHLKVGGCGFDAGHDVAYNLGYALFGKGYGCIGEGCQSNDHSNGDRDYTPDNGYGDHWHTDGGYAFRHVWA